VIANTNTRSKKTLERFHPLLALERGVGSDTVGRRRDPGPGGIVLLVSF
jgi:hypothetical protein